MPQTASPPSSLPVVRLEVRVGAGRPTVYEVGDGGFLIGSVPGCDLRLPGANLAPVLALIARHTGGASLRKLAPVQPVLVNSRAVGSTYLDAGDVVTVGGAEIQVSVTPGAAGAPVMPTGNGDEAVTARRKALLDQVHQLEADRAEWYKRRDEVESECKRQTEAIEVLNSRLRQQERELEAARAELASRERACAEAIDEVARQRHELESFGEQAAREQVEAQGLRNELAEIRQKLYYRYRTRRDRLDKQQQGVRTAAKRLQEQKRRLDAALADASKAQQEWALRQAELETVGVRVERDKKFVDEQQKALATRQEELHRELSKRVEDLQVRERAAADERAALDQAQKQHQADLVRLDRIQATLDQRKKQLDSNALDVDKRFEQLQRDSRELEEQATQLDEWHNRLTAETERLATQKQEQDVAGKQAEQRAAALEGQQAMLATLRTRLERMREELRRQEQALGDQRALQEAGESNMRLRNEECQRLRQELDAELALFGQEKKQFEDSRAGLDADAARIRQDRERLAAEQVELQTLKSRLEATSAEQAEQAGMLVARGQQLEALHLKLAAERQSLVERAKALESSEQMVSSLQEQLRKRGEDLAARERALVDNDQRQRESQMALEARQKAAEESQRQAAERLDGMRKELTARAAEIEALSQDVTRREEISRVEGGRLEESAKSLTSQRQSLAAERIAWEVERQAAREKELRTRADFEAARAEAIELSRQAPDLEARATSALDRLTRAREQLREHLAEVHAYARQSREDLETARKHVQSDAERMRQQELALHVARDEHRLAVAAFRQQLIEWQGQVGEMKQTLRQGETRLGRQQAEVNEQAERIASDAARLAEQAEQLQQKERQVAERRGEVDRHLTDMREWYRRKMRELSGVDTPEREGDEVDSAVVKMPESAGGDSSATEETGPAAGHSILSITGDVDAGDRQLGELLRTLGLMDEDTLAALLLEARRQRKSLRQLLLAGNYLTLYQMALIEAGNLDGLILGPVRVIDRLQATPREAVYRVFDPRSEREAVLRHLAENEMHDAVRPDEFRQRFGAATAVKHDLVAATYEVLDVAGRPAVLQEWVTGIPGSDWPALASAPGVWYRLVSQATTALQAVHAAGLSHGHLQSASFMMTGSGVLKLCGVGDPNWLAASAEGEASEASEAGAAGDLLALGRVCAEWAAGAASRKGAKAKPLPEALQSFLESLTSDEATRRPPTAAAILSELERVSGDVPGNAAAWERFIRQVREHSSDPALRRSA